jgi:hypothetical protein
VYAEAQATSSDGQWVRVTAIGRYGQPIIRVDWGLGEESDVVVSLPFVRAMELPSALQGVCFIAFDGQAAGPRPSSLASPPDAVCPVCGSTGAERRRTPTGRAEHAM